VSCNEERTALKSYRCDDWSGLTGAEVEIHRRGKLVRAGTVDAVMPDNSILWLAADYNGSRQLFESAEGCEVWANDHDMPGELKATGPSEHTPTFMVSDGDDDR
jgi:hypothetical protein